MSEADIRASAKTNFIINTRNLRSEAERRKLMSKFSLAALRISPTPRPIWTEASFMAEFGDSFLEATGLEGGSVFNALRVATTATESLLTQRKELLQAGLSEVDIKGAATVLDAMHNSIPLFRKVNAAQANEDIDGSLGRLLKFLAVELGQAKLSPGKCLMVPAGWQAVDGGNVEQHDIIIIVEATKQTGADLKGQRLEHRDLDSPVYRIVVCNGGEGREIHPVTAMFPPKLKYKTSIVFKVNGS
jgi:hypothetical protein